MTKKTFKLLFYVWIVVWLAFTIRELFVKGSIREYGVLLSRSYEGKHSYVTGDRLYEFLVFCTKAMPKGSSYRLIGLGEGSLEKRRAVYYLYPHLESEKPDYILAYDLPKAPGPGYEISAGLDDGRYILKRKGSR